MAWMSLNFKSGVKALTWPSLKKHVAKVIKNLAGFSNSFLEGMEMFRKNVIIKRSIKLICILKIIF
jgi:hypothetical protein